MSRVKHEMEKREDDWNQLARREGIRCSACAGTIPYEERQLYESTGLCAACASHQAKLENE